MFSPKVEEFLLVAVLWENGRCHKLLPVGRVKHFSLIGQNTNCLLLFGVKLLLGGDYTSFAAFVFSGSGAPHAHRMK